VSVGTYLAWVTATLQSELGGARLGEGRGISLRPPAYSLLCKRSLLWRYRGTETIEFCQRISERTTSFEVRYFNADTLSRADTNLKKLVGLLEQFTGCVFFQDRW